MWAQTGAGLVEVWKHTSLSTCDMVFTLLFLDVLTCLAAPLPVTTHACLLLSFCFFFFFFLYVHIFQPTCICVPMPAPVCTHAY